MPLIIRSNAGARARATPSSGSINPHDRRKYVLGVHSPQLLLIWASISWAWLLVGRFAGFWFQHFSATPQTPGVIPGASN